MKRRVIYSLFLSLFLLGCKDTWNEPKAPSYPIPQQSMDFFVNYDVGTCWIYKDTVHTGVVDTIELMSKKAYAGVTPDGEIPALDGFQLYYKPTNTKDFTVFVYPYKNNSCSIDISPTNFPTGSGVSLSYDNGNWAQGYYKDSVGIGIKMFYSILDVGQFCDAFYFPVFAKNIGLVSFQGEDVLSHTYGNYVFVKTIKK